MSKGCIGGRFIGKSQKRSQIIVRGQYNMYQRGRGRINA